MLILYVCFDAAILTFIAFVIPFRELFRPTEFAFDTHSPVMSVGFYLGIVTAIIDMPIDIST